MREKFMDISNDVIFKRVFGRKSNKKLLIGVLNEIIDELNIIDIEYLSPELTGFDRESKNSRMDLRVKTDTGHEVVIEMQVRAQHDFCDRAVYYAALPILEEVEAGMSTYHLTPRYLVSILHFSLDHNLGDESRAALHATGSSMASHWQNEFRARYALREQVTHEKLSEAMNLLFIELGRFNKTLETLENDKERFYFCLKHMASLQTMPEEFKGNELMETLFTTTALESMGEKERKDYINYMTTERDIRNQNEFAIEMAIKKGKAEGLAEGLAEGKVESSLEIAKAMLSKNIPVEIVSECTGLSAEQVANLYVQR